MRAGRSLIHRGGGGGGCCISGPEAWGLEAAENGRLYSRSRDAAGVWADAETRRNAPLK